MSQNIRKDTERYGILRKTRVLEKLMERMKGIEPSTAAWEAAVLPLNYIRINGVTVAA